ncbi:glycine oxidase [Ardenticatena maritima]|uniref:glycine oxidase n=1 Tax=Ardenticatena maritima TaxID=872965 RepID=A0A0M9UBF2_9CHLR|nr:glycine oxidase ThiO [Ardenticatena maritima]KPL88591.1 glycine oxidase [Ardenticatena maritima]GAP61760.1 glycine oxidase [Ardenticatena maritima]
MSRIAIVGGGIMGLGIGWYLAREGADVTVFDRGRAGRAASWVAGGMLAPHAEAEPGEERLLPLLIEGHKQWPAFVEALEEAAGVSLDYRTDGTLVVALDADDARKFRFWYEYLRGMGQPVEWLSGYEVRKREPHLSREAVAAIWSGHDYHVDNRRVVEALKRVFVQAGGALREETPVREIVIEGGRVRGVRLDEGVFEAETVVLAAGAWSREIEGLPPDIRPPVRPVRGQVVILQMPPEAPLLHHVVWCMDAYLVPRSNGQLLIGATVEEMGFDATPTAGGVFHLLRGAWELLPAVYDLPLTEIAVGFRPTSRDDAPILGPTPVEGLVMATGHHRNGILLAPLTADVVSRFVLTGELDPLAQPFTLARFLSQPA